MVHVEPIKNEAGYRKALAEIEQLMDAKFGTPRGRRLDALTTLVEAYEDRHHPIDIPAKVPVREPR